MSPQGLLSHLVTRVLGAFLFTGDGLHKAMSILSDWITCPSGRGAALSRAVLSSPRPPHEMTKGEQVLSHLGYQGSKEFGCQAELGFLWNL